MPPIPTNGSNHPSIPKENHDFLEESNSLLRKMKGKLATLTVASLKGDLEDYYFIFHTLKGNSRMIGQKEMQDLFHALGILVLDVRDFALQPNEEIIAILRDSYDVIKFAMKMFMVGRVARIKLKNFRERVLGASIPPENKNNSQEHGRQAQYFQALGIDNSAGRMIDSQDSASQFYEITITLEETVFLKKTRVYTIIRNLTLLDESVRFGKMTPSIEDLLEGRFGLQFTLILQSHKDAEQLKKIVKHSDEIAEVTIRVISTRDLLALMK